MESKISFFSPLLAILLFYLIFIFLTVTFIQHFYVPWVPILVILIVLLLCIFKYRRVAWFLTIFIISLSLFFCFLVFPLKFANIILAVFTVFMCIYGIVTAEYQWTAPLLALLISFSFIFFLS